ncbi:hypothetical protein ACFLWH_01765 [Chloroflexota bacterium]
MGTADIGTEYHDRDEDMMVEKDKPHEGGGEASREDMPKAIMTKPLPQILDELEDSIRLADEAGKNAREAAEEARKAGEKAAGEAAKVAALAIAKVEKAANDAMQLAELLKETLLEVSTLVEKRLTRK